MTYSTVEPIFETLSYCASLHPSNGPNNNPFGGFGDDDDGWEGEDGAFDDAAEPGEGDEQELSEAGRVRSDFSHPDARFRPY